jgi:hypothetical protein
MKSSDGGQPVGGGPTGHGGSPTGHGGEPTSDGSTSMPDSAPVDAPPPGSPSIGAHAIANYPVGQNAGLLSTPPITTQLSGSTIIVGVARGTITNFSAIPSDNKGNSPYQLEDMVRPYAHPNEASGTAVYAYVNAKGGDGFQVSDLNGKMSNSQLDEITMGVVEVVKGTQIAGVAWNEVTQAGPVASASVHTTGPAVLISFWWGENDTLQSVAADSGFTVVDSQLVASNAVQGAVAVKSVSAAGTYNLTWTATPAQGAQVWLIAVQ